MSRFIEVPARMLPTETLTARLEAFVTRHEVSFGINFKH